MTRDHYPPEIRKLLDREGTGISWAHLTFNPWIGCQKVSLACRLCYAETLATNRLGVTWGPGAPRRRTAPSTWKKPLRWNRIAAALKISLRVFCASLADWADNAVDDQWRADLATLISATPWLDWMLLTKRIGNAEKMLCAMFPEGVPENVWLGITICNQEEADRDMDRAVEVKHRLNLTALFVSAEPLLGPLNLSRWMRWINILITGGESGKDAAPSHPDWFRALRHQAEPGITQFHFKQWGEWLPCVLDYCDDGPIVCYPDDGSERDEVVAPGARRPVRTLVDGRNSQYMWRVGTAKAGRMLDGVIHDGGLLK